MNARQDIVLMRIHADAATQNFLLRISGTDLACTALTGSNLREVKAMNVFRIANRDLMPMLGVSAVFGTIGAAAIIGLATLSAPAFSLAALLP
jgi:hypothetical protein